MTYPLSYKVFKQLVVAETYEISVPENHRFSEPSCFSNWNLCSWNVMKLNVSSWLYRGKPSIGAAIKTLIIVRRQIYVSLFRMKRKGRISNGSNACLWCVVQWEVSNFIISKRLSNKCSSRNIYLWGERPGFKGIFGIKSQILHPAGANVFWSGQNDCSLTFSYLWHLL